MQKTTGRGRPKKLVKYTKTINVRLTQEQWLKILTEAHKSHLEPSVFIRKTILDWLLLTQTKTTNIISMENKLDLPVNLPDIRKRTLPKKENLSKQLQLFS